ncbi:MAG TPA: lysophospholipid acyltransferase family protein [Methylocystis sp.]|nr:lysophospholipid acyltransferase family protein [Methylocystis sp.]
MPYLRALAFIVAMIFFVVLVSPLQARARAAGSAIQHWIQKFFCKAMCRVIGIEVVASGQLGGAPPRFVAANHVSWTDIIAISSLYPLTFLAKTEVKDWPVLGYLARLQGTVFVDRGRRGDIPRVNAVLAQELRQGKDLVVFAEGTSSDGSSVLKFNASHFAMLRDLATAPDACAVAVVPVAFAYFPRGGGDKIDVGWYGDMTFVPHLWSLMRRGGARCEVRFGAPIDPKGFPDRKALADATQRAVERLLANAFRGGGDGIMMDHGR